MRIDYQKEFPAGVRAMAELERAVHGSGLEPGLLELVRVRASQANALTFAIVAINDWNQLAVDHGLCLSPEPTADTIAGLSPDAPAIARRVS